MTTVASPAPMRTGAAVVFALLGAGSGVLTALILTYVPDGLPWPTKIVATGGPFALLMGYVVHRFSGATLPQCALVAVTTVLAWQCAWLAGERAHDLASTWLPVSGTAAAKMAIAGLVGGFAGSALTALGIGAVVRAFRQRPAWGSTVAVGTVLGLLLALDDVLGTKDLGFWTLFIVWQAGVAWQVARVLGRSRP